MQVVANYEAAVLRPYHEELTAALGGNESVYPFGTLCMEFQWATVDFVRWLVVGRLCGFTPETLASRARKKDANQAECLRSLPRLVWLLRLAQECMGAIQERE